MLVQWQHSREIISVDGSLLVCSEGGLLKYSWVIFSIHFLNPAQEQDPLNPGRAGVVGKPRIIFTFLNG